MGNEVGCKGVSSMKNIFLLQDLVNDSEEKYISIINSSCLMHPLISSWHYSNLISSILKAEALKLQECQVCNG
jgi:hypothetical protein